MLTLADSVLIISLTFGISSSSALISSSFTSSLNLLENSIPSPKLSKTIYFEGILNFVVTLGPLSFKGSFITSTIISSPFLMPFSFNSLL